MRVDRVLFLEPLWLAYQYTGFLRKCKPCLQDFSVSGGVKSQKQYCGRANGFLLSSTVPAFTGCIAAARLRRRAVRLFRRSAAARLRPRPCRHKGDGREAGRGDLRIRRPGKRHRVPGRLLPGLTQILHMPDAEHFALRRKFTLLKTEKLPFTFGNNMCILVREQSRISRVKCCQNGELCDRRRTCVRDGISAPAAP